MRFTSTVRRVLSWTGLFHEAMIGVDVGENMIGIVVPGMLTEKGGQNNKGNVIVSIDPDDAGDMMAELRIGIREFTPAEMVRRTISQDADGTISFKVSNDPGTRAVKVAEEDWLDFLDKMEHKTIVASFNLSEAITESNATQAAENAARDAAGSEE